MTNGADISLILAIVALIISALHFIMEYFSKLRTQAPTINISPTDLPPYINNEAKTQITIENVGTSIAHNPELSVIYSYTAGETYIPIEEDFINLNEKIEKRERLVEPPPGTHEIKFNVEVGRNKRWGSVYTFTKTIEIVVE
ncbi:hypothetical protein LCGC14_2407650 [marine sediment metagenome]|uniref:CARDB domain-containing protein n=1 Tax=marine sediment metagenome TaxID=412755 RepID=A0A0F9BTK0_9ZZZZ